MNGFTKLALLAAALGATTAAHAQKVDLYVNNGGQMFRIVYGSNTGGRFVRTSPQTIIGGVVCYGYTDRASRGETVWALSSPAYGVASAYASGFSAGGRRVNYWGPHALPNWDILTISTDPRVGLFQHEVWKSPSHVLITPIPLGSR